MRWLIVALLTEVAAATTVCPSKCTCKEMESSMSCSSLTEIELTALNAHLSSTEWSAVRTLSIHDTPSFRLDLLPSLKYLETFDLSNNSLGDDSWLNSRNTFPSVKKLILEHNNFTISDFSTATSLRTLNVSQNLIKSVECDSITPMLSLEVLDLSSNNLTQLPGAELRSMEGLRTLLLSRNPIEVIAEGQARLDSLQVLDLSSSDLRVVEAGAFSHLPRLHSVFFTNCLNLSFISPAAFENISVFSLDISGTALKSLPPSLLSNVARIRIANVPLDCACFSEQLSTITTTTITDWSNATCVTRAGEVLSIHSLSPMSIASTEQCRPNVILPFGHEVIANVGQTFKIYCAGTEEDDVVKWKSPAGVVEYGSRPEFTSGFERLDYFTTTLFEPLKRQRLRKRTLATTEFFRLDVVLNSDAGEYECTIQRAKYTFTRKIRLVVKIPDIQLKVTHVGISSVHLAWNRNIDVQAVDRVALQVNSTSATDFKRVVLLSLHNIYCSYNLINLLPDRVYTICLRWSLTDDGTDIHSVCISERTQRSRSITEDLGVERVVVICGIVVLIFAFSCGKWIYGRYFIYLRARQQSKMIQSVSGQSVLSQRSNDDAITFENHQLQMCSSFSDRDSMAHGPLLINVT
ncbi:hypothetical protein Q1695_001170 [Nippostrongylus brasiliensis]|nr:hypothetical protein Q1695_001170 [Nippostrongylus brasiliensis]